MIVRFLNFIFTVIPIPNTDVYFDQLLKAYLPANILAPAMLDSKRVSLANEEEMSYREDMPCGNQLSQQFGFDVISIQHILITVISVKFYFKQQCRDICLVHEENQCTLIMPKIHSSNLRNILEDECVSDVYSKNGMSIFTLVYI